MTDAAECHGVAWLEADTRRVRSVVVVSGDDIGHEETTATEAKVSRGLAAGTC